MTRLWQRRQAIQFLRHLGDDVKKKKRRPLRVFGASLLTCEERGECLVEFKGEKPAYDPNGSGRAFTMTGWERENGFGREAGTQGVSEIEHETQPD